MPVSLITTPEPKLEFKVYVDETTLPFPSTTEKCVVSILSLSSKEPGFISIDGVTLPILIFFEISFAYS